MVSVGHNKALLTDRLRRPQSAGTLSRLLLQPQRAIESSPEPRPAARHVSALDVEAKVRTA